MKNIKIGDEKMYKLIATDLDGTLVTDDKNLTDRTIENVKKALKKNVKIMISSARAFYRLERYIDELDLRKENQYTICFNGAIIVENITGKVLYSKNLDKQEVNELINLGKELNISIMLYSKNAHRAEKIPEVIKKNKNSKGMNLKIENFNEIDFDKEDNYIYKIVFMDKSEKITEVRRNIPKEIGEKYEVTSSVPEYIEFVKKGIKKSEAIKFIMDKCKIEQEEVIAIGDGENDVEMLRFAGLGVAMDNADNYVKENADYITTSNNDDGVGKVIEKFILNE